MEKIIIQKLTDELRSAVSRGITLRLAPSLPTLSQLAGVESSSGAVQAVQLIRWYLAKSIAALDEACEFDDRTIEAEKLRLAYRLLLKLSSAKDNVGPRRRRARQLLGVDPGCTKMEWCDRLDGKERELMVILAERLLESVPKAGAILD